ncbi:hypothetical protein [Granulosicoccus antarcticus]|uniref:50S ribosomal protein L21 n=1 Tax=Granulosicoccus antarcticus IMCC3135 TaxID=1192854 RepID=A0A2Z2NME8_9GAMM|nr:hypothetical protein [Granulosicoccus antarcticus]ASJ70958.1 50S ribosomal protein L21 [Granulosicoccus antarcticus IMCC3135]
MELWHLFVLIALLLAVFLVGTQITFMFRSRRARKSREKLRDQAVDRALASRLFVGGRVIGNADMEPSTSISEPCEMQMDDDGAEPEATVTPPTQRASSPSDYSQDEAMVLRSRLQEQDETISQLQQVLDELTTTTATRESVNFLQKQLLTARTTVQQQEAELKQLRREMEQRRPLAATMAVQPADEQASRLLMEELDQANQLNLVMQEQLSEQLRRAEIKAEEAQQNAVESNRLRGELESLRADRSMAKARMAELQVRVDEQQIALDVLISQRAVIDALSVASQPDENERSFVRPAYESVDEHDDLKIIKGIGPVMEQRLHELGLTTFRQLAECSEQDIEAIATAIGTFAGHIKRDDWVGKARELAAFSKDPV